MKEAYGAFSCFLLTYSLVTLVGCESLQKKFTRTPKTPLGRPSPIVQFQDYTHAMTPLDRYRKHYAMFDYWNAELVNTLSGNVASVVSSQGSLNDKRMKRASAEALQELRTLQTVVHGELRVRVGAVVEERAALDQEMQRGSVGLSRLDAIRRALEAQTRQIHRDLYWRRVEDQLQGEHASPD